MINQISKKIALVGHFSVGKTSLVNQFVRSKFSEEYLTTIGVNIEKKVVKIGSTEMSMIIWDISGEVSLEKTTPIHLLGSHGIIYVFDLTRESTYQNIKEQLELLDKKLPNVPIKVIANKKDKLSEIEMNKIISSLPVKCHYTSSAKTGENVEKLFISLAEDILT